MAAELCKKNRADRALGNYPPKWPEMSRRVKIFSAENAENIFIANEIFWGGPDGLPRPTPTDPSGKESPIFIGAPTVPTPPTGGYKTLLGLGSGRGCVGEYNIGCRGIVTERWGLLGSTVGTRRDRRDPPGPSCAVRMGHQAHGGSSAIFSVGPFRIYRRTETPLMVTWPLGFRVQPRRFMACARR